MEMVLYQITSLNWILTKSTEREKTDGEGETSAFNNKNYYSIIKVKVDPHPYPTGFTSEDLQDMLKDIRAIKGVKNFKLNKAVEKTTV